MPWSGAGVFTRIYSWVADKAASIDITASRMDADSNDIVTNGLNNCLTRDGQGVATANLPMAGFRHTGAGAASGTGDYVTLGQIEGAVGSLPSLAVAGAATVGGTLAVTGEITLTGGGLLPNNVPLQMQDTGGASRNALIMGTGNVIAAYAGAGGYEIVNQSGTTLFWLDTSGNAAITGRLTAAGGETVVRADGTTYALSISGSASYATSAGSAASVPWSGVTSPPYIPGQSVETSASPTFSYLNLTGSHTGTASGYVVNPSGPSSWSGSYTISLYAANGIMSPNFYASSDARLKSDITTIPPEAGRRFVEVSRPVLYIKGGVQEAGFIAQEQHKAGYAVTFSPREGLPETVDEDGYISPADTMLALNYNDRIAFLTAALKDAFARISALEAK